MTDPMPRGPLGDPGARPIIVVFQGREVEVPPEEEFFIGRDADLSVDDNPFLHRRLLCVTCEQGFWWIINVGTRITATVCDAASGTQAWLAPKARLPLIFAETQVAFTAGAFTYRLSINHSEPTWRALADVHNPAGMTTIGNVSFTPTQKLLLVVLAEPILRSEGAGISQIPSSQDVARRLGWTMTRLNRKLDAICVKLERFGVEGLRGGVAGPATNRRARLVEYTMATNLVTPADLVLLEDLPDGEDEDSSPPPRPPGARGHDDGPAPGQGNGARPTRPAGASGAPGTPGPGGPLDIVPVKPYRESRNPLRRAHPLRPSIKPRRDQGRGG